jgi:hypothetical protein
MLVICRTGVLDSRTNSDVLPLHCGNTVLTEGNEHCHGDSNLGVGRLQLHDVPDTSMICIALSIQHRTIQTQSEILCKIYVSLFTFYFIADFPVDISIVQTPFADLKKKNIQHF